MSRCLAVMAIATLICTSPVLAADDAQTPPAGGADTSSGAKEQSSAPAGSKAEEEMSSGSSAGTSSDTSTGAKEQSSAPPGSSAADVTKATTKADCDKAGGMWNVQSSECAQDSAKMGKEEGTHEGANLGATPEDDTKKVDQPERATPD
jgi:hypothetical protein